MYVHGSMYITELAIYAFANRGGWETGSKVHQYNTRNRALPRTHNHRSVFFKFFPDYFSQVIFTKFSDDLIGET